MSKSPQEMFDETIDSLMAMDAEDLFKKILATPADGIGKDLVDAGFLREIWMKEYVFVIGELNKTSFLEIYLDVEGPREGFYTITSKNLPGLFLAGKEVPPLIEDAPNVIKLLFKYNYKIDVDVWEKV